MGMSWKKLAKTILPPNINRIEERFSTLNQNINDTRLEIKKQGTQRLEAMANQLMHQQTLERVRRKYREGKKIHVCFLVVSDGKFVFDSIYKAMEQSEQFIPECILIHKKDYDFAREEIYWEELQEQYRELTGRGYKVTIAYDEKQHPIPLESYEPDILFLFASYLNIEPCYFRDSVISPDFLTCYVNYAMRNVKLNDWMYNNPIVNSAWINFVENYDVYKEFLNRSYFGGKNVIVAGYPKLDNYFLEISHNHFEFSLKTNQKTVVYAPHWSMCNEGWLNISTFHLYYKYFENLVKTNPDIRFVFKPHPDIPLHLRKLEKRGINPGITSKEYSEYVKRWEEFPNGIVYLGSDYIPLFRHCDCLITDCGSFTSEWLPSKSPCLYLINPENKEPLQIYNELGRKILDSYYCCHNQKEIDEWFQTVLIKGKDEKYSQRMAVMEENFINVGSSGTYIVNYLINKLAKD
ncbi:MAG: hypothetical protein J1F02_01080 [Lachnospiraceae bacterium]|nr:hypothetical protein [Lachnospiraceae bacterium]